MYTHTYIRTYTDTRINPSIIPSIHPLTDTPKFGRVKPADAGIVTGQGTLSFFFSPLIHTKPSTCPAYIRPTYTRTHTHTHTHKHTHKHTGQEAPPSIQSR